MKKNVAAVLSLFLIALPLSAEFSLMGGMNFGYYAGQVKYDGEKLKNAKIPFGFNAQFDFWPSPSAWLGFSFKTMFSFDVMPIYELSTGARLSWDAMSGESPQSSFSFRFSPNAAFRKVFADYTYLQGNAGLVYGISRHNMSVNSTSDHDDISRLTNTQNKLGLNLEVFYQMGKSLFNHGFFIDLNFYFLEGNSNAIFYDGKPTGAVNFCIAFGYQIGGSWLRNGESGSDRLSNSATMMHEAFEIDEDDVAKIKSTSLKQNKKDLDEIIQAMRSEARLAKSPIFINRSTCTTSGENVSLQFEIQNVSGASIKRLSFEVVPLDESGREIDDVPLEHEFSIDLEIPDDNAPFTLSKRNFWKNPAVKKFRIKKIVVVTTLNFSTVTDIEAITLDSTRYRQKKALEKEIYDR